MYYYSPKENSFYPEEMKEVYEAANSFPEDARLVDDTVWLQFGIGQIPEGKYRVAGDEGLPVWASVPEPTEEERKRLFDKEKDKRIQEAVNRITPLQYAVNLDMATEKEVEYLKNLQRYVVLLNRLENKGLSIADIKWPTLPTE